jgi:hypothetical protein
MLPTAQKFLGRVFAHREQECPSGKGSVSREVKKALKIGFQSPGMPFSGALSPVFGLCLTEGLACLLSTTTFKQNLAPTNM